ncbi:MAG: hypothetical protein WCP28_19900 [Actinomycetes bacterium]
MKRLLAVIVVGSVLAVGVLGSASAQDGRSSRSAQAGFVWTVDPAGTGSDIVVTSPKPITPTDSLLTVRSGSTVLGVPTPDAGFTVLRLHSSDETLSAAGLSLWQGGRLLSASLIPVLSDGLGVIVDVPVEDPRGDIKAYDPTRRGPYDWARADADLGLTIHLAGLPQPVEDVSELTYPVPRARMAAGKFPVVVLLHGRHDWCYAGQQLTEPWPCQPGSVQVPSYLGYRYMADRLATQGYVVLSISANGINAQDNDTLDLGSGARAALIAHHMRRLVAANSSSKTPWGSKLLGRVDARKVLLMGHSRGGEGVVAAAQDARSSKRRWHVSGVLPLAPTDFGLLALGGTPSATILPACDGDVANLQGQMYIDHGAAALGNQGVLRTATWVPGANHNFFNTQWTPGISAAPSDDDAAELYKDPATSGLCKSDLRLTPARERAVGLSYITNAAAAFLRADERALPYLDGRAIGMPSNGRVQTRSTPTGGAATQIASAMSSVISSGGMNQTLCQITSDQSTQDCLAPVKPVPWEQMPHWSSVVRFPQLLSSQVRYLHWDQANAQMLLKTAESIDLTDDATIGVRTISMPDSASRWAIVVRDANGRSAVVALGEKRVGHITTGVLSLKYWAQWASTSVASVRRANPRLDLRHVKAVGLRGLSASGQGWVFDAWTRQSVLTVPGGQQLPEAFLRAGTSATVGAPGPTTLPVRVDLRIPAPRNLTLKVSLAGITWADKTNSDGGTAYLNIARGKRFGTVAIPTQTDQLSGAKGVGTVGFMAISGAETGSSWAGTIAVTVR